MRKSFLELGLNCGRAIASFALVTLVSSLSLADGSGFMLKPSVPALRTEVVMCEGVDGEVRFDLLFEIENAPIGPVAVAMRVSDPNVAPHRAEIALFEYTDGLLNNNGNVIVGYVDPSNPKTGRKGERIGGTNLGQLRSIMVRLDVDFDVASAPGKKHSAQAVYLKKIGEELVQDLDCTIEK